MLIPVEAASRDGLAIWESRCEECHGDPAVFSSKYLWDIDGQLQGRHHIDNLKLFMGNHYIPDHEIDTIRIMLLSRANSPVRFKTECSGCHGGIAGALVCGVRDSFGHKSKIILDFGNGTYC